MAVALDASTQTRPAYLYARLSVLEGSRILEPCEICPEWIAFREAPHLVADCVEIVITNGDEEQRQWATVLPHDPEATEIPIRLFPPHYLHPDRSRI